MRTTSPPPRPSAAPGAAIEYNVLAARAATAALAFDEAAARLRTALDLRIRESRRARGGVSRARYRQPPRRQGARCPGCVQGDGGASRASFSDGQLLARAAIGYEEACWRPGIADQGAAELLEEAAAALGDESSELRVGLLSGLARALDYQGEHERGAIVRDERRRHGPAASAIAPASPGR